MTQALGYLERHAVMLRRGARGPRQRADSGTAPRRPEQGAVSAAEAFPVASRRVLNHIVDARPSHPAGRQHGFITACRHRRVRKVDPLDLV